MQLQPVAILDVTHINGELYFLVLFTDNVLEFVYYRYNIFNVLCTVNTSVQEETVLHKLWATQKTWESGYYCKLSVYYTV